MLKEVIDDGNTKNANGKHSDPKVMVSWDGMSDVEEWEDGKDHVQILKRHLWNKDKVGAW